MQQPDHIVIVVEENHDADQVIGSANAPYINGTLLKNGLYYSNAHGTDHPSQPNYLELFAGTNPGVQGVNSPLQQHYQPGNESTPAGQNALNHGDDFNTAQPFSAANLGAELLAAGKTFAGYSEDQPSVGFTGAQANGINGNRSYVEKHNPWAQFQGTGANQLPAAINQPFTTFQQTTDFSKLPTVSFVVPNEYNDMHDTVSKNGLYADPSMGKDANGNPLDKFGAPVNDAGTIQNGDTWLSNNIEAYREWATTHNSLLITVWDENDYDFSNPNNIPMIVDGDPRLVQQGVNSSYVNHFDLLKTVESAYGLGLTGAAETADGLSTNATGKLLANPLQFYLHNNDGTFDFAEVQNGTVSLTKVGGYGADWQTVGSGDYLGDGHTDVLLHNTTSGALTIAEVNNGQATYTQLGGYGNEWQALASGTFDASGNQDALLHNTQTGALVLASVSNGHASFTQIGGFGNEWTSGTGTDAGGQNLNPNGLTGDILNDGHTGVVLHNTTTGAVVVAEDVNGSAQFTQVGAVGNEWQFLASGNVQGNGHTDLLLHNTTSGALVLGEVTNGQLSYATVGGVGNEWQAAGAGDYLHDGHTGVLLHNATSGALVEGELVNGQMHYTQISGFGNDWHIIA